MQFLHTMVRVNNIEKSLAFYCDALGLVEVRRKDHEGGKFTLVFLRSPEDVGKDQPVPELELTYNWGSEEDLGNARNFGHLAYRVEDIYATCQHLMDKGITINRPPRDGRMAFVKSPDNISIELLQMGDPLPIQEPWKSLGNDGSW